MATQKFNLLDGRSETYPARSEVAARAALERHGGRALTDAEWARARARLLEFISILRTWDRQAKTNEFEVGNVVCIRKPRP